MNVVFYLSNIIQLTQSYIKLISALTILFITDHIFDYFLSTYSQYIASKIFTDTYTQYLARIYINWAFVLLAVLVFYTIYTIQLVQSSYFCSIMQLAQSYIKIISALTILFIIDHIFDYFLSTYSQYIASKIFTDTYTQYLARIYINWAFVLMIAMLIAMLSLPTLINKYIQMYSK